MLFYFLCWWQRKKKHWPIIDCRSCESDLKRFLNLFCFEADSRMWAGEDRERDGAHQWAGSHCYVWDGIGPWTHHSGWMHSFHWIAPFEGLVQIQPGNVFFFLFFCSPYKQTSTITTAPSTVCWRTASRNIRLCLLSCRRHAPLAILLMLYRCGISVGKSHVYLLE